MIIKKKLFAFLFGFGYSSCGCTCVAYFRIWEYGSVNGCLYLKLIENLYPFYSWRKFYQIRINKFREKKERKKAFFIYQKFSIKFSLRISEQKNIFNYANGKHWTIHIMYNIYIVKRLSFLKRVELQRSHIIFKWIAFFRFYLVFWFLMFVIKSKQISVLCVYASKPCSLVGKAMFFFVCLLLLHCKLWKTKPI